MKVSSNTIYHSKAGLPSLIQLIGNDKIEEVKNQIRTTKSIDFYTSNQVDYTIDGAFVVLAYGNLIHGIPCCVVCKNISLYIDVMLTNNYSQITQILDSLNDEDEKQKWKPTIKYRETIIHKKTLYGYQDEDTKFIRLSFKNNFDRCKAIKLLEENRIDVYSNDKQNMHRNVWAEYALHSCSWLTLNHCEIIHKSFYNGIILEVDIKNIKNNDFEDDLHKYKQIIAAWDIETKTYGELTPHIVYDRIEFNDKNKGYEDIKMISLSFKWLQGDFLRYPNNLAANFVISSVDMTIPKDFIAVICVDQFDVIKMFFHILYLYQPAILMDFNGSQFDWRMVIPRAQHVKSLEEDILKTFKLGDLKVTQFMCDYGPKDIRIKIDGNNEMSGMTWGFLNCSCLDLLINLKKDFEYLQGDKANINSLNDFLTDNKLPLKKDMAYSTMWEIFETKDLDDVLKVAEYALQDTLVLHLLNEKRMIITTIQEIGDKTFTNMNVGIFRANGIKITNWLRECCIADNKLMIKKYTGNQQNPSTFGGLVLEPNKGLHAYNIFDFDKYSDELKKEIKQRSFKFEVESIRSNQRYVGELQSKKLRNQLRDFIKRYPAFIYNKENEDLIAPSWVADRPSFAIDIKSSYPSSIIAGNLSPDTKTQDRELVKRNSHLTWHKHTFAAETWWILQHNNNRSHMGVFAKRSLDLFNERVIIKKKSTDYRKAGNHFMANLYTSKEKAIKLILNTTYGLYIDKTNSYFKDNFLGQGTCNYGRFFLLLAKIYLEHKGCIVNYGDTDSNYASPPSYYFAELDNLYKNGTISTYEYNKRMVEMTIEYGVNIGKEVDQIYRQFTPYVGIAFEEVLFRPCFIQHKHYWGIQCTDRFIDPGMIKPEDLLQRGIVTRKRDKSQFVKTCFYELISKCCAIDINQSVFEICREQIYNLQEGKYDRQLFKQVTTYKKGSQGNVRLHTFVNRHKKIYGIKVSNLQKFEYYVVIEGNGLYANGTKIKKIGEKMFLADLFEEKHQELSLKLDMRYYIKTYIGSISSILTYKHDFQSRDIARRYMLNLIPKTDDKNQISAIKKTYKERKNDQYLVYNFDVNMQILMGNDFTKCILIDMFKKISSKLYYTNTSVSYINNEIYVDRYNVKKYLTEMINIKHREMIMLINSITKEKMETVSKLKFYLDQFNTGCAHLNTYQSVYIECIGNYEKYLKQETEILNNDNIKKLQEVISSMEESLTYYVIYYHIKTKYI